MIWVIVIILLALGAGWYFWTNSSSAPIGTQQSSSIANVPAQIDTSTTTPTPTPSPVPTPTQSSAPMSATVTYDGSTFSPATVTIAKGGTITWKDTSGDMWIGSDPHPVHNGYDGTTRAQHCAAGYAGAKPFDQCKMSTSYTFTFTQVGSWGYHDHLNSSGQGTVIVQ